MPTSIEFAYFASPSGMGALRVGFVLTIVALAFILRHPSKATRKKRDK